MVTEVRQRAIRERHGRRGGKHDPVWTCCCAPVTGSLGRLAAVFTGDDPTGEIGAAWGVKERLRMLLAATDRHTIAARLHRFHETVLAADLPEAQKLAETVDAWWPEILDFLETRITNAGTEGTNRLVKDAARTAFGFRNLDNQRRRVRFHCTRRSHRNTSAEAVHPLNFDEPHTVMRS